MTLYKQFILILLCCMTGINVCKAQVPELINSPKFKPVAEAAVDSIYNFNFEGAENLLKPWKEKYPDHPLWQLMKGMTFWWQVLSDLDDTSNDEQFFYIMKKADYEASKLLRKNSSHADGLIVKVVSNGYIARQYANRDEWLTSLNRARKALSAYDYLSEVQPDLDDLKLAEGLKLYYSAYLPEAYPIVNTVSWFLPEGNKVKGLQLMQVAAKKAIFARAEATYFLGNINYNYEHNYDRAGICFRALYQKYPNNNYYARLLVKSLYHMKKYDEAMDVIEASLKRWDKKKLPFEKVLKEAMYTWKGRILARNSADEYALEDYRQAFDIGKNLPRTKYRRFHVISGFYLGQMLYNRHQYGEARRYLELVRDCKVEEKYQKLASNLLNDIKSH